MPGLGVVGPDVGSGGGGGGAGTTNTVAKWVSASELGDSSITDDGSTVTVDADLELAGAATGAVTINGVTSGGAILSAEDAAGTGTFKLPSTTGGTFSLGFLDVPINSQSDAYSTTLEDRGKCILHPASDTNNRAFTINGALAYPVGSVISFLNLSANAITIPIATDTLTLIGAGTTGTRTLAQYGFATAIKAASGAWVISGTNLT